VVSIPLVGHGGDEGGGRGENSMMTESKHKGGANMPFARFLGFFGTNFSERRVFSSIGCCLIQPR